MTKIRLLTVAEAAELLGVPEKPLKREAEKHGHLIRVGSAVRIPEDELGELVEKCRFRPKTATAAPSRSMLAGKPDMANADASVRHAYAVAAKLKSVGRKKPTSI